MVYKTHVDFFYLHSDELVLQFRFGDDIDLNCIKELSGNEILWYLQGQKLNLQISSRKMRSMDSFETHLNIFL